MTSLPDIRCIKGLNDRFRLPRLGKIRLGIRREGANGKRHPVDLPHFVVPDAVKRVYGAEPTELKILLPSEDLREILPYAYKWYGASAGLKCKGDGEVAIRRWAEVEPALQATIAGPHAPNDLVGIPCPCPRLKNGDCTLKAHFLFLLPEVSVSGVWQIDTQSRANVLELSSVFRFLQRILGRVAMLPLTLRREPVRRIVEGTPKTQHLLKLTYDGGLTTLPPTLQATPSSLVQGPLLPHASGSNGSGTTDTSHLMLPAATSAQAHATADPAPAEAHEASATPVAAADVHETPPPPSTAPASPSPVPATDQPPHNDSPGTPPGCGCGTRVTARIAEYSQRVFGQILCITCQKHRHGAPQGATP